MQSTKAETKKKPKRTRRNRRVEILEATTGLLAEYGFQGMSLAMVAEKVGLTEPGVLHYFPNKVALLQGVLDYRDEIDVDKYASVIDVEKDEVDDLFNSISEVVQENEKIPELLQLFTVLVSESIRQDQPSHNFFVDRYRRGRKIYKTEFTELLKTPIRSDVDAETLAPLVMAMMDGLQIQWLLDPENVDLQASFNLFAQMVSSYLKEQPD
jgi:AcrR family transcriptional regulator